MATKIRLKRMGRRNRPFFRVVVIDSRKRRDGAPLEELGWYDPIKSKDNFSLRGDRIIHWLNQGAQPTITVKNLMKKDGLSFRWHLIRKGLDEKTIDHELQKWLMDREEREKQKIVEKQKLEEKTVKTQATLQVDLSETGVIEKVVEEKVELTESVSDEDMQETDVETVKVPEKNGKISEGEGIESKVESHKVNESEVVEEESEIELTEESLESEDKQGQEDSKRQLGQESDEDKKTEIEIVTDTKSDIDSIDTALVESKKATQITEKSQEEEKEKKDTGTGDANHPENDKDGGDDLSNKKVEG